MLAYVGGYKAIHDLSVDKSQGMYIVRVYKGRQELGVKLNREVVGFEF